MFSEKLPTKLLFLFHAVVFIDYNKNLRSEMFRAISTGLDTDGKIVTTCKFPKAMHCLTIFSAKNIQVRKSLTQLAVTS